jgi:hypothetical protein
MCNKVHQKCTSSQIAIKSDKFVVIFHHSLSLKRAASECVCALNGEIRELCSLSPNRRRINFLSFSLSYLFTYF